MSNSQASLSFLLDAMPSGGLFSKSSWQWTPTPFLLDKKYKKQLLGLGNVLHRFHQASDEIYRRSGKGNVAPWLANLLDKGKPQWMIDHQRSGKTSQQFPRVIRPDLLLTEHGLALAEIDSVPGGIGITAWLSQTYTQAGYEIIGGANGMLRGFEKLLDQETIIAISEESADYLPEMQWLISQIKNSEIIKAEDLTENETRAIYRFFELFDFKNIAALPSLTKANHAITAPIKPHLEEKLWLALFHTPGLQGLWKKHLRHSHLKRLQKLIPQSWIVRDTELPPEAELPKLSAHSWHEVAGFSQSKRKLVLKISGFHETSWGSRGVHIGHDLSAAEWSANIQHALSDTHSNWLMQEFAESKIVEQPYFDSQGNVKIMNGRVRLCPYYFTDAEGHTSLHGCLATIVPDDKKKIHGMSDAILCPVGFLE